MNHRNLFLSVAATVCVGILVCVSTFLRAAPQNSDIAQNQRGSGAFPQQGGKVDLAMMWSQGRAVGKGPVRLKTFPLRIEDIGHISPMGLMVGGHVTPSDHLGIAPKDLNVPPDRYDVLAPSDGVIVMIQRVPKGNPDPSVRGRQYTGEYWVTIEHTGTFWTYIGLIEQLDKSIGDFDGQPRQFWVKGNAPDPAQISKASGLVKYELIWQKIGSAGQPLSLPDIDRVQGVLLAQLLDERKLKVEVFPGRTAAEVSGFTNAAVIYER